MTELVIIVAVIAAMFIFDVARKELHRRRIRSAMLNAQMEIENMARSFQMLAAEAEQTRVAMQNLGELLQRMRTS